MQQESEVPAAAPPNQPWSFALFALLVTLAIVVVGMAVPGLIMSAIVAFQYGGSGPVAVPEFGWADLMYFQAGLVGLTLLMSGVARGSGPRLGWQAPIGRMRWLKPALWTIGISTVTTLIAQFFFADIVARDLAPIMKMMASAPLWMAFVALTVGAPLSEELLFRGFLLHRLEQTPLGFWGGALVANTGWTALHYGYSWLSLADVFLAGLLFSWALWRTRSIWVPIAFHMLYNAAVFFFLLIPSDKSALPAIWQ